MNLARDFVSLMTGGKPPVTDFEKSMQKYLQDIIAKGGLGLSPEQISARWGQMTEEMKPYFNRMRERSDVDAARRGIFSSGIAAKTYRDIGTTEAKSYQKMLQDLMWRNEQAKLASLMQALGMGSGMATNYGNLMRGYQAQNQQAMMGLLPQLVQLGLLAF